MALGTLGSGAGLDEFRRGANEGADCFDLKNSAWVIVPGVGKDDLDPLCGRDRGHVPHHRRWAVTWKSLLPPELLRLPEQLARVDALLDDPVFFGPVRAVLSPGVRAAVYSGGVCYLRLMSLKFRCRLSYESLCAEVSDSISWRRFCRIPLDGRVPHRCRAGSRGVR